MTSEKDILVRTARLHDADAIGSITARYADEGLMLKRSPESIIENIRNFFVAEIGGKVVGCCAISFFTLHLAEIRTLAVCDGFRQQGVGARLVEKAEAILREEGVQNAFVLTLAPQFFSRQGYVAVEKELFPQKIWRDCTTCPKLMYCDEVAMQKAL